MARAPCVPGALSVAEMRRVRQIPDTPNAVVCRVFPEAELGHRVANGRGNRFHVPG